jgi:uncharacterized membrane protein
VDDRLESLEARVGRLEHAMAGLREADLTPPTIPPPPHAGEPGLISPPPVAPPGIPGRPPPPAGPRPPDTEREAVLAGTWLARVGIAAVLLGVAFAFKYAVDRGLIGPTGRVLLGVAAGVAFVVWGERARAREWPRLAQAVTGGGVGLMYLSVWASFGLYDLIPPAPAFALLAVVVAGGVGLALRHDSEALSLVALFGAFLNPYLTGIDRLGGPLFAYVLLVDLGVVALVLARQWRLLEAKALAGTWLIAMIATEGVPPALVETFAAAAFLLFSALVLMRTGRVRSAAPTDPIVLSGNAVAFFGVSMVVLASLAGDRRGELTLLLAGLHLGAGLLARRFEWPVQIPATLLILGVAFGTVAVPLQLEGFQIPIAWAFEAVLLVLAGRISGMSAARWIGLGVLGLSLVDAVAFRLALGILYEPARAVASIQSVTLLVEITALYSVAWLLARPGAAEAERSWATVAWVGGNLLTVGWLSLEARAALERGAIADPHRAVQFTFTAIWSLYAGVVLTLGITGRRLGLRLLAIALFAATVAKMALIDVWLLEPLLRTIAFTGLGLLLLLGSLMYHRFRDLILEGR